MWDGRSRAQKRRSGLTTEALRHGDAEERALFGFAGNTALPANPNSGCLERVRGGRPFFVPSAQRLGTTQGRLG